MRRLWDKGRITDTLRKLHDRGQDLSYNRMAGKMQPLVSAAAYHFGSYRKAVAKAGLDYDQLMRRPRWSKPIIIGLIKQARRKGEDLHWSAVTRRRDELGKAAFASLQPRLFGSWERALAESGLDAERIARYRRWDRDSVVDALRLKHRKRQPLNSGAVQKCDPGMHAAAVRHFGSYDDALRAAGLDPIKLRQRRRWSKEDVVAELRVFRKKHGELSDADLRRHAPALYGAAIRTFKTLAAAQKAAK